MNIRSLRSVFALILVLQSFLAFAQGEASLADSATVAEKRHMVYISGRKRHSLESVRRIFGGK